MPITNLIAICVVVLGAVVLGCILGIEFLRNDLASTIRSNASTDDPAMIQHTHIPVMFRSTYKYITADLEDSDERDPDEVYSKYTESLSVGNYIKAIKTKTIVKYDESDWQVATFARDQIAEVVSTLTKVESELSSVEPVMITKDGHYFALYDESEGKRVARFLGTGFNTKPEWEDWY